MRIQNRVNFNNQSRASQEMHPLCIRDVPPRLPSGAAHRGNGQAILSPQQPSPELKSSFFNIPGHRCGRLLGQRNFTSTGFYDLIRQEEDRKGFENNYLISIFYLSNIHISCKMISSSFWSWKPHSIEIRHSLYCDHCFYSNFQNPRQ